MREKEELLQHYEQYKMGEKKQDDPELADFISRKNNELKQQQQHLMEEDPDLVEKYKPRPKESQNEKLQKYQQAFQSGADQNQFMFDNNQEGLSKGEAERQKRLKLREEERKRRLMGDETSVYDQQAGKRENPLEQLERQIKQDQHQQVQKYLSGEQDSEAVRRALLKQRLFEDNQNTAGGTPSTGHYAQPQSLERQAEEPRRAMVYPQEDILDQEIKNQSSSHQSDAPYSSSQQQRPSSVNPSYSPSPQGQGKVESNRDPDTMKRLQQQKYKEELDQLMR